MSAKMQEKFEIWVYQKKISCNKQCKQQSVKNAKEDKHEPWQSMKGYRGKKEWKCKEIGFIDSWFTCTGNIWGTMGYSQKNQSKRQELWRKLKTAITTRNRKVKLL